MTKIMSKTREQLNKKAQRFFDENCMVQEPTVACRKGYATETYNDSEEYPFMETYNDEELANRVLVREEEYTRTSTAVDFQDMMADFKNEFEW